MKYIVEQVETSKVSEKAAVYGIPKSDMAGILGVSEKTFYNIMQKEHLDRERSDRFHFIHQVLQSGKATFGSS